MRTLAIETSCDDTSVAIVIVEDGFFAVEKILAYTQTKEHKQRGGVVPELAARSHAEKILVILDELAIDRTSIDTISVTAYPGLPWALIVGITTAYTLWKIHHKPVVEVNHIMGHVFSVLVERSGEELHFPYICLTVSGGHNDLYIVENEKWKIKNEKCETKSSPAAYVDEWDMLQLGKNQQSNEKTHTKHNHLAIGESVKIWKYTVTKLWQTIDDAAGECFDKVARMLGGPYPGGRWIDEMAQKSPVSHEQEITLHAARLPDQPYNFSFSGIKGQLYQHIENWRVKIENDEQKACVASVFQEEVTDVLVEKLEKAVVAFGAKTIGVVWGVSANARLRQKIATHARLGGSHLLFPTQFVYCTDNAAMIGVVGLMN